MITMRPPALLFLLSKYLPDISFAPYRAKTVPKEASSLKI